MLVEGVTCTESATTEADFRGTPMLGEFCSRGMTSGAKQCNMGRWTHATRRGRPEIACIFAVIDSRSEKAVLQ